MNYYQFHIGDYISHTHHLTNEEDLTYRRMLDLYYQTEQAFDESQVEKIARKIKSHPETVQQILEEFFELYKDDSCWHNKRADEEISKFHLKSDRAKTANQIRWGSKMDEKSDPIKIATNNHKPITNNQEYIDRFDTFWKHYPRKVAKPNALKAWLKIKPDDALTKQIIAAVNAQGLCNKEIQFVPHPASWLNANRWEDEIKSTSSVNEWWKNDRRIK
jgi:uncharacterized protein YdaU (DUF1376 family)